MMRRRRLTVVLTLTMLVAAFLSVFLSMREACGDVGGKIDLYTNKVPYDGRGLNQQSDAFQPQELVELYARVTYNDGPIANWLVAFQVLNPLNETVTLVANRTDSDGTATFSFRVPGPSEDAEQAIFGYWRVVATVDIAGQVFMDTLTFRVGWIVQVIDIKTLDGKFNYQTSFLQGETIVFNLTVQNIALTSKSAVVVVEAFDAINCPIIHAVHAERPVIFQPGKSFIQVISKVPSNATVGKATVYAVACTALPEYGGVAYSPPCMTYFNVLSIQKMRYYLTVKTEPLNVVSIPGEGWYDEGAIVSLNAPEIVSISPGARYKFKHWDVDGVALNKNPIAVVMDRNHTATAHYSLQYFLRVVSPYGVVGGEGWYDANAVAYAFLNAGVFDHGNGTRRVFVSWGGDASGTNYAQSDPIIMNAPKKAVANWKTQYYLSLQTNPHGIVTPTGEGWYDSGTYAAISTPAYIHDGLRFHFVQWTTANIIEIADPFSPSTMVLVDEPKTVTANYVRQYRVTFIQIGLDLDASGTVVMVNGTALTCSDLPYNIWVDENSVIVYSYENRVSSTVLGKRFIIINVTGPPSPINVTADVTVTGNYKTQYYLEVSSAYGSPTPTSGWFDSGSSIVASVGSPVSGPTGTRYVCTGWTGTGSVPASGTGTSVTFTLNAPSSITWNWKTQYLLTVVTDPPGLIPQPTRTPLGEAGPVNGWWYDAYTNVSLLAPPVSGYDFSHWEVDGRAFEAGKYALTVFMDGPHEAIAHYRVRVAGWFPPEWYYWILILILLLVIVLLCVWIYRRRKKAKAGEAAFKKGWAAWYYGYDLLGRHRG